MRLENCTRDETSTQDGRICASFAQFMKRRMLITARLAGYGSYGHRYAVVIVRNATLMKVFASATAGEINTRVLNYAK